MKKKWILLLLALCLALGGCGQNGQVGEENDFTAVGGEGTAELEKVTLTLSMRVPETLNPLLNREETVDRILKLMFLPLLEFDESGKPAPAVAESWQLGADGKTVTLQLREDILWQNGGKLTADDVVFTFQTLQNAGEGAVYKKALNYISGCEKKDDHTVLFTFHENFSGNLSALRFPVISESYYSGETDLKSQVNMTPMGNGPYSMYSYTQASELVLETSDLYHGERPHIPRISVKITAGAETDTNAFQQGMTDVLVTDATEAGRYANEAGLGMYQYTSTEYDFIGFNFGRSLFQDKALRQAVAYALPKESLMDSVYLNYGVMTNTPISPKSWLYEENVAPYNYDTDMAATFLKNSGWTDANGDHKLEKEIDGRTEQLQATILVNQENTGRRQIAARLKEELQAIGFTITIDQQPFQRYQEKFINGEFDLIVGGWDCNEVIDLSPFFATAGSLNYINYTNAEVDQLLAAARTAIGEGQTLLAYSSLQKKLAEELPYISIAYRNEAVFTSKYVGGEISPTDFHVYRNIEKWTYKKGE